MSYRAAAAHLLRALIVCFLLAYGLLAPSGCHSDQDIIDRHQEALDAEDD